jgi:hypothetical protein
MRPRFSLRWLLIAFTVLSLGFYLFFIRPTVIANQFVSRIDDGEVDQFLSLYGRLVRDRIERFEQAYSPDISPRFTAVCYPQTWTDFIALRRTISVSVWIHPYYGTKEELIGDFQLHASAFVVSPNENLD